MQRRRITLALALSAVALAAVAAGCGGGRGDGSTTAAEGSGTPAASDSGSAGTSSAGTDLSGSIEADGSSTVGPFVTAAAEQFQEENPNVRITVGISGTGGGFERFCNGETDISDASRQIEDDEAKTCADNGIEYVEFHVATDALTVVVNKENTWATCLTVDQLKKIWEPSAEGKVTNWNQVDPSFPDVPLTLAGAGTDSGTFDYFTKAINGEEGASRTDYQASEDDNTTVVAVEGDKGGLGYFGYSYYEANQDKLNAVQIDAGSGCVTPSVETAQDGTYTPLSRPLFVYVKKESFQRPEVQAFIRFILDNEQSIAQTAKFVPLTEEQLSEARSSFTQATAG
jgi:phosphate transport system substrate-binding protein